MAIARLDGEMWGRTRLLVEYSTPTVVTGYLNPRSMNIQIINLVPMNLNYSLWLPPPEDGLWFDINVQGSKYTYIKTDTRPGMYTSARDDSITTSFVGFNGQWLMWRNWWYAGNPVLLDGSDARFGPPTDEEREVIRRMEEEYAVEKIRAAAEVKVADPFAGRIGRYANEVEDEPRTGDSESAGGIELPGERSDNKQRNRGGVAAGAAGPRDGKEPTKILDPGGSGPIGSSR